MDTLNDWYRPLKDSLCSTNVVVDRETLSWSETEIAFVSIHFTELVPAS